MCPQCFLDGRFHAVSELVAYILSRISQYPLGPIRRGLLTFKTPGFGDMVCGDLCWSSGVVLPALGWIRF